MRLLLAAILAAATSVASAAELRIVLINGTNTDIAVESKKGEPQVEVLPQESKVVLLQQLRWLRFGQEAHKYSIGPIVQRAKHSPASLVLQANSNGWLYVVPPGTKQPQAKLPPQPKGFPLKPTRKADLT